VSLDLDDVMAQEVRCLGPSRWARMVKEAVAHLVSDAARGSGRVLLLNLHAHVSGQPFRIRYVEEAVGALAGAQGVWLATPSEVVDCYLHATTEGTAG
jgi:hypothetical protein